MLLANYGAIDGKQIIPAEWVKAATTPEAPHLRSAPPRRTTATATRPGSTQSSPRRRGPVRFAALGVHGQAIFIDPARKLVVVHTAVWADGDDRAARGAQFKLLEAIYAKLESQ